MPLEKATWRCSISRWSNAYIYLYFVILYNELNVSTGIGGIYNLMAPPRKIPLPYQSWVTKTVFWYIISHSAAFNRKKTSTRYKRIKYGLDALRGSTFFLKKELANEIFQMPSIFLDAHHMHSIFFQLIFETITTLTVKTNVSRTNGCYLCQGLGDLLINWICLYLPSTDVFYLSLNRKCQIIPRTLPTGAHIRGWDQND